MLRPWLVMRRLSRGSVSFLAHNGGTRAKESWSTFSHANTASLPVVRQVSQIELVHAEAMRNQ